MLPLSLAALAFLLREPTLALCAIQIQPPFARLHALRPNCSRSACLLDLLYLHTVEPESKQKSKFKSKSKPSQTELFSATRTEKQNRRAIDYENRNRFCSYCQTCRMEEGRNPNQTQSGFCTYFIKSLD
jgi:hypothetical protein